jgi:lysozyme family protein
VYLRAPGGAADLYHDIPSVAIAADEHVAAPAVARISVPPVVGYFHGLNAITRAQSILRRGTPGGARRRLVPAIRRPRTGGPAFDQGRAAPGRHRPAVA